MNKIFFDIETIPADEKNIPNLKYLFERKLEKKSKKKDVSEESEAEGKNSDKFEKYFEDTSMNGAFGRVLCIAYTVDDGALQVICHPDDEKKTVEEFWSVVKDCNLFIGHNIMAFDLKFLYQRSVVLKVRPTQDLSFARYRNFPIFDTMQEWSKWDISQKDRGLEPIALALGLPTPKDGIDGSEVYTFFKQGKIKEICDYCMRDVETTRLVYKRMTFEP